MEHGVTNNAISHVKSGLENTGWCLRATSDVDTHAMRATVTKTATGATSTTAADVIANINEVTSTVTCFYFAFCFMCE